MQLWQFKWLEIHCYWLRWTIQLLEEVRPVGFRMATSNSVDRLCHCFMVNSTLPTHKNASSPAYENCSGPMVQHYGHGATIFIHPIIVRKGRPASCEVKCFILPNLWIIFLNHTCHAQNTELDWQKPSIIGASRGFAPQDPHNKIYKHEVYYLF